MKASSATLKKAKTRLQTIKKNIPMEDVEIIANTKKHVAPAPHGTPGCGYQQSKSEDRACIRCGEIGHTDEEHHINCSSCEQNHPLGECPMGNITCFLCEGQDHYPVQCRMYSVFTSVMQRQRKKFRRTIAQELARQDNRRCKTICYCCREKGHYANRCPEKHKHKAPILIPEVTSVGFITPKACSKVPKVTSFKEPAMVDHPNSEGISKTPTLKNSMSSPGITCFKCQEIGHFASNCPKKRQNAGSGMKNSGTSNTNNASKRPHNLLKGCLSNVTTQATQD